MKRGGIIVETMCTSSLQDRHGNSRAGLGIGEGVVMVFKGVAAGVFLLLENNFSLNFIGRSKMEKNGSIFVSLQFQ